MADIGTAYVQIEPTAKGISKKIEGELGNAGTSGGNAFNSGFGKALGGFAKITAKAVGAGAAAVGGLVKSASSAYAEFEQLEGGAKLLFGSAFDTVIDNADSAFARVQMSANDYLQQANGYATGLKEALGGDVQAAAELADGIMVAQADIVAATGQSQEAVQNAFNGIMKNNFMMLDNLAIGIKPTKEGMQEVIDKMNEWNKTQGKVTNYQMGNLADMESALVDYVSYVGMAGYAHEEASKTITGSLAAMKAQWENTLVAMSQGDGWDMGVYIGNLVGTVKTFADNVMPIVQSALVGISELISGIGPEIAAAIPSLITQVLPGLLEAGLKIIETLAQGILTAIPQLMPSVTQIIMQITQMLIGMLPQLLQIGIEIVTQLINGITQTLPQLLPQITQVIPQIVQTLIDNIPMLLNASIQLIQGLVDGIIAALPILIEAVPQLIQSLVDTLVGNLQMLIDACIQMVNGIVAALPEIITALLEALPTIMDAVTQGLIAATPQLVEGCIQLMAGIIAALPQITAALIAAMPQIMNSMAQAVAQGFPVFVAEFTKLFTSIVSMHAEFWGNLIQSAVQKLGELIQAASQWLGQLPVKAAYFAGKMAAEFINALRALPSNLKKLLEELIKAVKDFGKKFVEEGPKIAKEFINKLIEAFKDAKSKMGEIGNQIVEGLKEGIKKSWTAMTDWIKELAASLIKGFKDNLKIKSPSKVFADEVGKWIPLGIAEGIKDGMGDLDNTVVDMAVGITGATNDAMSATTYQAAPSNDAMFNLLSQYLPLLLNKKEVVDVVFTGGLDRFFRAMQIESQKNYQLTGVAL